MIRHKCDLCKEGENEPIDRAKFEALKDRYHELRGWDTDNGWPVRTKLLLPG